VDGVEDDGAILHRSANRTDLVHGPAQRHCARSADAAIGRAEASCTAAI
jgi:hypothetical protein